MRFAQDHLTFKALCVLHDAVARTRHAPVEPTPGLRFALAYLWSVSNAKDRKVFDDFWLAVTGKAWQHPTANTAEYIRGSYATTYLNVIC